MPGPRLHRRRPAKPDVVNSIYVWSKLLGFDVAVARLLIGERSDLRRLGRYRAGQRMYTAAEVKVITAALERN